jgi:uncharacterized membrane protein YdjX (TVP38/TMEM64 family)
MELAAPPPAPTGRRGRLAALLSFVGVLLVASNVGTILSATLVNDHPAVLLALSSRNRHLLLTVAAGIAPGAYALIGFARICAPAAAFYLLGRWYGDRGLRWLERQSGGLPPTVRWVERGFDRFALPLVVFMPGSNLVCLLAGARRMSTRTYAVAVAVGVAGRLAFFWFLGKAFQDPLTTLLDWIGRYQWWLAGGFFVLTVAQSARRSAAMAKEQPPVEEDAA